MADDNKITEEFLTQYSQLYTNLVNLDRSYYDMFYNPVPMDINLKRYDSNGVLQEYVIPNRAKDSVSILKGSGDPNGVLVSDSGVFYLDISSYTLYYKAVSEGSYGWVTIFSESNFAPDEDYLRPDGDASRLNSLNMDNASLGTLSIPRGGTGVGSEEELDRLIKIYSRSYFQIVEMSLPTTEDSLKLADGSILNCSTEYQGLYNKALNLRYSSQAQTYFISEEQWQAEISSNGVCGKYVLDENTKTIRLPKIVGFTEGSGSFLEVGNFTPAGLPTYTYRIESGSVGTVSGSSYPNPWRYLYGALSANKDGGKGFASYEFDLSKLNPIYGRSETVQPSSIKTLYYIHVGER